MDGYSGHIICGIMIINLPILKVRKLQISRDII